MLPTYAGILRANQIEWGGEVPPEQPNGSGTPVLVTLLAPPVPGLANQGERLAEILAQLAALPSNEGFADPLAWEREIRTDRALPGREE